MVGPDLADYKESDSRERGNDYRPGIAGRIHTAGGNGRCHLQRCADPCSRVMDESLGPRAAGASVTESASC